MRSEGTIMTIPPREMKGNSVKLLKEANKYLIFQCIMFCVVTVMEVPNSSLRADRWSNVWRIV